MRSLPVNTDYKLHFSLTKICLECRTTSHVDDVVQVRKCGWGLKKIIYDRRYYRLNRGHAGCGGLS